MIKPRDGLSFSQIRLGVFRSLEKPGVWYFDGDAPVQLLIAGKVNETEPSLSQDFLDAVAADLLGKFGMRSFFSWMRFAWDVDFISDCLRRSSIVVFVELLWVL